MNGNTYSEENIQGQQVNILQYRASFDQEDYYQKVEDKYDSLALQFIEPNIEFASIDNPLHFETMLYILGKSYLPIKIIDGKLYCGLMGYLLDGLYKSLFKFFPPSLDKNGSIIRMLTGGFTQKFYSLSEHGKKVFDIIYDKDNSQQSMYMKVFDLVMGQYLKEVIVGDLTKEDMDLYNSVITQKNYEVLNEGETFNKFMSIYRPNKEHLRISDEGLLFLEGLKNHYDIDIQAFNDIIVSREPIPLHHMLDAFISAIYFEEELYFYYSPVSYDSGICSPDKLYLKSDQQYITMNFSEFVKGMIKDIGVKIDLGVGNTLNKGNDELIDGMLNDFRKLIKQADPQSLEISIKGISNTVSQIEMEKLVSNGFVGQQKSGGQRIGVGFEVKDGLNNYKKRIKKRSAQISSEDLLRDAS